MSFAQVVDSRFKIKLYLYRRMLEDNEEDIIERIKTTFIMLKGMTRNEITKEMFLHIKASHKHFNTCRVM